MSLLIKALASAEKNKQTGLKKKRLTESDADASSSSPLALEPLSPWQDPVAVGETEPALVINETGVAEKAELSLASDDASARNLSIQEEPALAVAKPAMGKYAKSNTAINKSSNKAEAFKTAAAAGVANAKLQFELAKDNNQKAAASVFVANQAVKHPSSKSALILLGVAGALMIWLGLQGYQYIQKLSTSEVVVVKPAPPVPQIANEAVADNAQEQAALQPTQQVTIADQNDVGAAKEKPIKSVDEPAKTEEANPNNSEVTEASFLSTGKTLATGKTQLTGKTQVAEADTVKTTPKKLKNSDTVAEYGEAVPQNPDHAAKNTPLKLISRTPVAGVDPTLLAAYQAFTRGDDAAAQQQYRQVLQADVRNVDALLGMAAIAQRQGRDADANGWYQKVLEIEPRNHIAQSAIASLQVNANIAGQSSAVTDLVGTESRIKNMLALQPEAANLHAALGNLYAVQNQWPAAQEAYFNASRFAPNNADYVFNLAVSLDQLGKSGLALAQYQRALDLINSSGAASFDKAQLEARIQALQASR